MTTFKTPSSRDLPAKMHAGRDRVPVNIEKHTVDADGLIREHTCSRAHAMRRRRRARRANPSLGLARRGACRKQNAACAKTHYPLQNTE